MRGRAGGGFKVEFVRVSSCFVGSSAGGVSEGDRGEGDRGEGAMLFQEESVIGRERGRGSCRGAG
jgi:hypothetical protein